MNRPLRILHLEDEPDYCDLVQSLLAQAGYQVESVRAQDRPGFEAALDPENLDVILADYSLPSYNGLEALRTARDKCPDTPFLLVSGTIGEQAAIESLKAGATDYVLKHWPERLVPAIRRAVEEARERAQRRRIESELVRREQYLRAVTENTLDILTILSREGVFTYNSPSVKRLLGYEPEELTGKSAFALIHPEDLPEVRRRFELGLIEPQQMGRLELRFRHKDGSWCALETIGQNCLDDPEIGGVVVNSRDISDRKQAEASLRESEARHRQLFDGNPMPLLVFEHETLRFLEVNEAAVKCYGYSREEFRTLTLRDIRPPEDVPSMIEYVHKFVVGGVSRGVGFAGAWRHRRKDGTIIEVEIQWSPICFEGRAASLAMVHDITERKRIEHRNAALSKLGQSLSAATSPVAAAGIIRAVADELFAWDVFTLDLYSAEEDRVYSTLNVDTDRCGRRLELPVTGQARFPSGMARRIITRGAELSLREEPVTMPPDVIPIGDTTRPSVSLMLVPIRNRTKVIGILSIQSYRAKAYDRGDLDTLQTLADHCGGALERIRAEQALRDSEQRFRDLFEGSPDAIFVEDTSGTVLDLNPAACRLHATTRQNLIGKNVFDLIPPGHREKAAREFRALVEGRLQQVEGASCTQDGRAVPVEVRASRIQYAGRDAVLLHVRDITDRKLAEEALRGSEMRFHSVWENSADGMRLTDANGKIVTVNDAFCKLVGMPREKLEGNPFTIIYADSEQSEAMMQEFRQRFRDRVVEKRRERRITLRNGKVVVLEDSSSFVELRGQPPLLLGLFRDVTAQKRLEEQLRQSQKMEAIGQLAGGVAHDFNNILTVIHGHASLLMAGGSLTVASARSAQQIAQAAERAAGLTRQLLTFSRRQVMQPRRLDMNEVVANMTKMLGRILGEDITLQLNYFSQPALVQADAGMMEQVLLNLAVNSRDAMPKGGVLGIRIAALELDARCVREQSEARAGRFVCLSVSDTGCGIPPENLRRIFEPFFTTKEVGKGTGLGLATVYGIVKQHQGWIEVESEIGKGTTFRVFLPRSAEAAQAAEARPNQQAVKGGRETILVVEDEDPVRDLVCRILSGHGYRILEAASGVKALEVWQASKGKIDLLLTDLVMPDRISGRELAETLWAEHPRLKVLFISGYSAEVAGRDFVLRPDQNYLQKPYPPQKLALAVRDCLDAVN
jgi:PAS domain S-box-containing protein